MSLDRLQVIPALRARWRFALLLWLLVVGAAVAVTFFLPARYEATAALVVDMGDTDPIRGQAVFKPAGAVSTFMATQVDVMQSEAVARGAVRILGLDKRPRLREAWREETGGRGDFESWLAAKLVHDLAVLPSHDSNQVTLSYTSDNPDFSAAAANAFVKSYADTTLRMQAGPARQFNAFFHERAALLRQTLDQAKARLSAYEQKHGLIVSSDPKEPDVEATRLANLTAQLVGLQDEATAAANRQRQAMTEATRMREVRSDPEVMEISAELAKEEADLSRLQTNFGARHPSVVQSRKSIADLRARLSAAMKRAAATFNVPVRANTARLAEVKAAIEKQRAVVLERQSQRNAAAALLRDVDNAQHAYDAVLQRASQTALQAANTTQPNIAIVKSATPPPLPRSLLKVYLFVALLIGPLLAVAAALLREARDRRLRTFEDVTGWLRQPLLLALPDGYSGRREAARRSLETQRRLIAPHPRLFRS